VVESQIKKFPIAPVIHIGEIISGKLCHLVTEFLTASLNSL
jgi:hypothetical protein